MDGRGRDRHRDHSTGKDPGDGLRGETLDDVALLEVVIVGKANPALVVRLDLADVVAEAPQRLDPIGRDDLAIAPDTSPGSDDPTVGDERTGDDRALADPEDMTDLRPTLDALYDFRLRS